MLKFQIDKFSFVAHKFLWIYSSSVAPIVPSGTQIIQTLPSRQPFHIFSMEQTHKKSQSLLFSHITESQATKLQQYVKTSLLFWTQQHHKICHPGTSTTTDTDVSKASFYVCVSFGVCTILHCAEWIWVDSRYFTFLFSYTEKAYFLWYSSVSFLLFYSHAVNNSFVYL